MVGGYNGRLFGRLRGGDSEDETRITSSSSISPSSVVGNSGAWYRFGFDRLEEDCDCASDGFGFICGLT